MEPHRERRDFVFARALSFSQRRKKGMQTKTQKKDCRKTSPRERERANSFHGGEKGRRDVSAGKGEMKGL